MPNEMAELIIAIVKSLDKHHGADRSENQDGGYVIFVENKVDLELACELEIDIEHCTVEYAKFIPAPQGT